MKLVTQQGRNDCGVACIAMLAEVPYEAATSATAGYMGQSGISIFGMWRAVSHFGLALQARFGPDTPTEPWAPAHLLTIQSPTGGHYVVADHEGRILDPAMGTEAVETWLFGERLLYGPERRSWPLWWPEIQPRLRDAYGVWPVTGPAKEIRWKTMQQNVP